MASNDELGEVLEGYRPYLKVLARIRIRDGLEGRLDASGIVQDVFLAALQARDGPAFCRGTNLLPWLRRILANVLANKVKALRAAKRGGDLEVSLHALIERSSARLDAFFATTSPSPSDLLLSEERCLRLAAALYELPDRQQEAILLHHIEGLPIVEVARLLGTTTPAVTGLLRRGLEKLRAALMTETAFRGLGRTS